MSLRLVMTEGLEQIEHSYTVKARAVADTFKFKGRIMNVEAETFTYKEGDNTKTGYKLVFRTTEELDTSTMLAPATTED